MVSVQIFLEKRVLTVAYTSAQFGQLSNSHMYTSSCGDGQRKTFIANHRPKFTLSVRTSIDLTKWRSMISIHDDVFRWKHFPRYWPFVRRTHRRQRPVTRSLDVFFDLRPNKRLSKQLSGWGFETHSPPSWRHSNEVGMYLGVDNWWPQRPKEKIRLLTQLEKRIAMWINLAE